MTTTEDGLLAVAQALVLVPLDPEEFTKLFGPALAEVREHFRTARYEEIVQAQLIEEREGIIGFPPEGAISMQAESP